MREEAISGEKLEARVRELVFGGEACRAELNALLRRDEAARPIAARVLVEEAALISELRLENSRRWAEVLEPRTAPTAEGHGAQKRSPGHRRRWIGVGLAAAACVAAMLWIHREQAADPPPPVAAVTDPDSWVGLMRRAEGDHLGELSAPVTEGGMIELGAGRARIDLDNGVVLSLTGPARLSVGLRSVRLWQGEVVVDVPQDLDLYVVETDDGRFVDLGTVFSVSAQPEKPTEMAVLSGEVRAERISPAGDVLGRQVLRDSQGAVLDRGGRTIRGVQAAGLRHGTPIPADDTPLAVPPTYRAAVDAAGPLLVWDFDVVKDRQTVPNRAGPQLTGLIRGDVKLSQTVGGDGHLLLGGDDRAGWIDADGFWRKPDREPFTVELWARPDRIQWGHLLHLGFEADKDPVYGRPMTWGTASYFSLEFTRRRELSRLPERPAIRSIFRSPATESSGQTLPGGVNAMLASPDRYVPGRWHHLVARVGRQDFTLFVDGRAITRQTIDRPDHGEQELQLRLGRLSSTGAPGRQFVGAIDEVAIYPRALSDGEVLRHCRAMTGR